jgi:hypothetical protein
MIVKEGIVIEMDVEGEGVNEILLPYEIDIITLAHERHALTLMAL